MKLLLKNFSHIETIAKILWTTTVKRARWDIANEVKYKIVLFIVHSINASLIPLAWVP